MGLHQWYIACWIFVFATLMPVGFISDHLYQWLLSRFVWFSSGAHTKGPCICWSSGIGLFIKYQLCSEWRFWYKLHVLPSIIYCLLAWVALCNYSNHQSLSLVFSFFGAKLLHHLILSSMDLFIQFLQFVLIKLVDKQWWLNFTWLLCILGL